MQGVGEEVDEQLLHRLFQLYGGDLEEEDDDDSFVELDPAVEREIHRRSKETITTPPSYEIINKVRSYFLEQGGEPAMYGGYLDIMEKLGAIDLVAPQDSLVKDSRYNSWRFFLRGEESEEEQDQIMANLRQYHRSRVRLLRYRDFIRLQQEAGLGISPEWHDGFHCDQHPLEVFQQLQQDDQENPDKLGIDDSKLGEDEWNLTDDEILELGKFTMGFYAYANHEAIYVGLGAGQEKVANVGRGGATLGRTMQFQINQQTLLEQVDLQCPLGPKIQLEPKTTNKKKKKNKKGSGNDLLGTHGEEIQMHLQTLLQVILDIMCSPTGAIGQFVTVIAGMLQIACSADRDVAVALIRDTKVLELRQKALNYAKDALMPT